MIEVSGLSRIFKLHNRGGMVNDMFREAALGVARDECVALTGRSGAGKSTPVRIIPGNCPAVSGTIRVSVLNVTRAEPREILTLRRETPGHVSQFLRAFPHVPTRNVVTEPPLAAILCIFHHVSARARVADREIDVSAIAAGAAA